MIIGSGRGLPVQVQPALDALQFGGDILLMFATETQHQQLTGDVELLLHVRKTRQLFGKADRQGGQFLADAQRQRGGRNAVGVIGQHHREHLQVFDIQRKKRQLAHRQHADQTLVAGHQRRHDELGRLALQTQIIAGHMGQLARLLRQLEQGVVGPQSHVLTQAADRRLQTQRARAACALNCRAMTGIQGRRLDIHILCQ